MVISLLKRIWEVLVSRLVKTSNPQIVLEFEIHDDKTGSWKIELIESGRLIAGHDSFNNPIAAKRRIGELQQISLERFGKEAKFVQRNEEFDLKGRPIAHN